MRWVGVALLFALPKGAAPAAPPTPALPAPVLSLKVTPGAGGAWRMQLFNGGDVPVRIAADPNLLILELTPKADENAKKAPAPLKCILPDDARPSNDEGSELVIPAQRSWSVFFDPRFYCFGAKERAALTTAGTTVKATFGWPLAKKTKLPPSAPYVASPVGAGVGKVADVKAIEADAFTVAEAEPPTATTGTGTDADPNVTLTTPEALDAARGVELGTTITLTNGNSRPISLYFRPEMFLFNVSGPNGTFSCGFQRQVAAPIRELFATIGSKGKAETSVLFSNVCPAGTFDAPGIYRVEPRLDLRGVAAESLGLKAFVGVASSNKPLLVRVRTPRRRGARPRPTLD